MNIIFRVDSSSKIGTGHLMRCLVLAEKLKDRNCNIIFICKNYNGNISDIIVNKGFKLYLIEQECCDYKEVRNIIIKLNKQIDWLIIDNYNLDLEFEIHMKNIIKKIMVIDDFANRYYFCNMLLNQNLYNNPVGKYKLMVPHNCKMFLGLEYLLLRDEFKNIKREIKHYSIRNILVSFGGTDNENETTKVLEGLRPLQNININVVVGSSNINKYTIKYLCYKYNYNYLEQINNMAELINKSDLAIGAGGISLWERCYLGLPSIVSILADNQKDGVEISDKLGCIVNLSWYGNVKSEDYYNAILNLTSDKLKNMSSNCFKLFNEDKVGELVDCICENR